MSGSTVNVDVSVAILPVKLVPVSAGVRGVSGTLTDVTHVMALPANDKTPISACLQADLPGDDTPTPLQQLFDVTSTPLDCWPWTFALIAIAPVSLSDPTGQCTQTNNTYQHLEVLASVLPNERSFFEGSTMSLMAGTYYLKYEQLLGQLTCNGQPIHPKVLPAQDTNLCAT